MHSGNGAHFYIDEDEYGGCEDGDGDGDFDRSFRVTRDADDVYGSDTDSVASDTDSVANDNENAAARTSKRQAAPKTPSHLNIDTRSTTLYVSLQDSDELLAIEPAFRSFAHRIVGGTYTSTDESGDACAFTQQLAERCAERGVQFMYGHDVVRLQASGGTLDHVVVRDRATRTEQVLRGGAVVAAEARGRELGDELGRD